jgi:hypothetical protein
MCQLEINSYVVGASKKNDDVESVDLIPESPHDASAERSCRSDY